MEVGRLNLRSGRFTPGNDTLVVTCVEKIVAFVNLNILRIMYLFTKELPNTNPKTCYSDTYIHKMNEYLLNIKIPSTRIVSLL